MLSLRLRHVSMQPSMEGRAQGSDFKITSPSGVQVGALWYTSTLCRVSFMSFAWRVVVSMDRMRMDAQSDIPLHFEQVC